MKWGLYVHIPFCRRKCLYCDFPSYAGQERLMPDYVDALKREMFLAATVWHKFSGSPQTVYIGGGTPTVLGGNLLGEVIRAVTGNFGVDESTEFTVEVNPGTADKDTLLRLRRLGVNRLSIGVQSFDDRVLNILGRIHDAQAAQQTINDARCAGFDNISLDLMYGLPGQSLAVWRESLERAVALGVTHISAYGLQLEAGTEFYRRERAGKLALPDAATEEAMYDLLTDFLPAQGYGRYEISNFAQPGYFSRHNMGYWQNVPYGGLGAAAHSYIDGERWQNTTDLPRYIKCLQAGQSAAEPAEPRGVSAAMAEFAFLALRTNTGINRRQFLATFGKELDVVYGAVIDDLTARGLVIADEQAVRLTKYGAKWGNVAFAAFIPD